MIDMRGTNHRHAYADTHEPHIARQCFDCNMPFTVRPFAPAHIVLCRVCVSPGGMGGE